MKKIKNIYFYSYINLYIYNKIKKINKFIASSHWPFFLFKIININILLFKIFGYYALIVTGTVQDKCLNPFYN